MQRHVARHEGIGPAQHPHGDVLRSPVANAGQGAQGLGGGRHIGAAVQHQAAFVHRAGQGHDGRLALAHDAQLPQRVALGPRQHSGCGKQPLQLGPRGVDGLAKALHQPLAQRAGGGHGDLLAQHGAHGQFQPIPGAGHAQAVAVRKVAMQHGVDGARVCVQVQQAAHAPYHGGQRGVKAVAGLQQHLVAGQVELRLDPAGQHARACRFVDCEPHGAAQAGRRAIGLGPFHPGKLPLGKEGQQGLGIQRGAVSQAQCAGGTLASHRAAAPQGRGAQAVVLGKCGIEAAHAAKATGQRHLGDGQGGVGQQLLGRQQPAGLQVLQGRQAQLRLKQAPQVPVAHAQPFGQR